MFIGHFGLGFGAKRLAPTVSLGTLFLACQFADLLWPVLVLTGIEVVKITPGITVMTPLEFVSYPYSHSLVMLMVWGFLFALGYHIARKGPVKAAVVLGVLVVSHWFLDVVMHLPDMPLTPAAGSPRYGFALWNSREGTLAIELLLFGVGIFLYLRSTRARDRIGTYGLWALVLLLLFFYAGSTFGPPPPSVEVVGWGGIIGGLILIALATWVDHHRTEARETL